MMSGRVKRTRVWGGLRKDGDVSELIDTTEMYLRTVYELEEEGVPPLRARIAERLSQTGPTVSQTVQRMERDGLLHVAEDRHIELTPLGRHRATSVMRKHRLAEVLLTQVIGLEWELVHEEACRWEHVISDAVEARLVTLLDNPSLSPYGNPIPVRGSDDRPAAPDQVGLVALADKLVMGAEIEVQVERLSEALQNDPELISLLADAGIKPGCTLRVETLADRLRLFAGERLTVDPVVAHWIFVRAAQ